MTPMLHNRPFADIHIGDSARLTRTVTGSDIRTFAVLCGDVNPLHVDERFAAAHGDGRLTAHGMWAGALVSSVLGNELPGPGTVCLTQQLRFVKRIAAADTITATVTVREKRVESRIVVLDCECANQHGEIVALGSAEVIAAAESVSLPRPPADVLASQAHEKFEQLLARVRTLPAISTAVAHPCSDAALGAVVEAAQAGLIVPTLVGPAEKIHMYAQRLRADISDYPLVDVPHSHAAAAKAVELVRQGTAQVLMKGSLHTDELLAEVVKRDTGLRTERRLSHVFVMDVPSYHKPLMVTDAAINIYPTLEEKADICRNAIDLAHALRIAHPKVAILSAVETINPKIPSTTDAASLCKMAERGQITGGILDGPLAMDNAISREAAAIKGIVSQVAGDADVLLVPDLEAGNILAKQLTFMAQADAAGIVLGARVPIVLTSRADGVRARLASCAVAVVMAHVRQTGKPG